MRFLADESCDFSIVRALRASGYDVLAVCEISPRAQDSDVMTEDKDFGQLVFAHGQDMTGVIFLRFPTLARKQISKDVVRLVKREGEELKGCFTVVQPGRIRISRKPGG
jgi:predicted nuclease of predicted toxin-antitoxin system